MISYIGHGSQTGYNSLDVPFPQDHLSGDLLLLWFSTDDVYSIGDIPSGWTQIISYQERYDISSWLAWKVSTGESGSVTIDNGYGECVGVMIALRGADNTSPVDTLGSGDFFSLTPTLQGMTTTTSGCMLLLFAYGRGYELNCYSNWNDAGSNYSWIERDEIANPQGGYGCVNGFATAMQTIGEATGELSVGMAERLKTILLAVAIKPGASSSIASFLGISYENTACWLEVTPANTDSLMGIR